MKKSTFFIIILSIIFGIFTGYLICELTLCKQQHKKIQLLQQAYNKSTQLNLAYDQYNLAVENLLDKLDSAYSWVDSFDPQDYYNTRTKLDSLIWNKYK